MTSAVKCTSSGRVVRAPDRYKPGKHTMCSEGSLGRVKAVLAEMLEAARAELSTVVAIKIEGGSFVCDCCGADCVKTALRLCANHADRLGDGPIVMKVKISDDSMVEDDTDMDESSETERESGPADEYDEEDSEWEDEMLDDGTETESESESDDGVDSEDFIVEECSDSATSDGGDTETSGEHILIPKPVS